MKKIREIILDFTPLLDVTLIILFYFILFSHLGAAEAQQKADQAIAAAEAAQSAAAEQMDQARLMQQDAQEKLEALAETDARGATLEAALEDYARSENLKLLLNVLPEGWTLRVCRGKNAVAELTQQNLSADLTEAIRNAGFLPEDTVLCDLIYDADEKNTNQAYLQIAEALENVRKEFPHLYISETDLSK